jgi:hypothetical protein
MEDLFTMQAEFVVCYEATGQTIWLKNSILGLHMIDSIVMPLTLFCDNETVVFSSKNNKLSGTSK